VTDERQFQDNIRYYLQQVTRAQEEERQRIARELHDETLQNLIVISRQLEKITSSDALWEESHEVVRSLKKQIENTVQEMLGIGDRVSEIFVVGKDYRDVEPVYTQVAGLAGDSAEVLRWYEIDSYLGAMLDLMDGFVLIWIVVIFLALSFGLVNTLMMAVFERVREIGLMLALGMKPINILGQVIIESLLLLGLGLLIGSSLAWASVQPIRDGLDVSIVGEGMELWGMPRVLYPELLISDVILANVVVLVLGVLASLSPAWRASHYEPIEAITKA